MIIESSPAAPTKLALGKGIAKKLLTFTAYSLLITFGVVTTIAVIGQNSKKPPTGTYLSPLPKGELAQGATPTPSTTPSPRSTPELINLAQNHLNKAFKLSQTKKQTPELKKQIIESLDKSLNLTTQAIRQDPQNPKGYILRAQILTAVSKANPSALAQAQKDLETAQGLSQNQPITLPEAINPLDLLPDQQALASTDLILAAPEDTSTSTASAQISSNSFSTQVILPAKQTELTVENKNITADSYVYLIPAEGQNATVFVKSKTTGRFTITTPNPLTTDLIINYYIINP